MLLNLLLHDYDDSTERIKEIAQANDLTENYGHEDSQQRGSEISAVLRERDDKTNDIFHEESLNSEKMARIQRDDAGTTTPKPTTMRGTPLVSSTTGSVNRGFYVTKAITETTYAPIEATDFPEDVTDSPAQTTKDEFKDEQQAGDADHDRNKTKYTEIVTETTTESTVKGVLSESNRNVPLEANTFQTRRKDRVKNTESITLPVRIYDDDYAVTELIATTDKFSPVDYMSTLDPSVIEDTTLSLTTAEQTRGTENKETTVNGRGNTKRFESTTLIPTTIEFPVTTMRMTTAALQEAKQNAHKRGRYRFRTTTNSVSPNQEHFGRKSSRRITNNGPNWNRSNRREGISDDVKQNESSTKSQNLRRRVAVNRGRQRLRTKVSDSVAVGEPERQRKRFDQAFAANSTAGTISEVSRNETQRSVVNTDRSHGRKFKEPKTTFAPTEIVEETTAETIIQQTASPTTANEKKVRELFAKEQGAEDTEFETTTGMADETIATTVAREISGRAVEPVNEINFRKNTRPPRPATRRPGTFSRNELLNRLKERAYAPTTLPPFFSDLQSTAALLTNIRKIKPTESSPTTLPSGTENIVIHVDPTELPTTPDNVDNRVADANDQAIRAQELALSLVDAPLSQSTSGTGERPSGNSARRRISTTVAPRPKPETSKTSIIRQPSVARNRQRQSSAPKVPDYVTSRPRRPPVIDYDYYEDDEERIVGKSTLSSKLFLTNTGTIRCLDQGNFPHPYSCKKFITCARIVNGLVIGAEYTCPDKLSFDPVGGICNWSAGLGCKER